jgi:hypothetical protein
MAWDNTFEQSRDEVTIGRKVIDDRNLRFQFCFGNGNAHVRTPGLLVIPVVLA